MSPGTAHTLHEHCEAITPKRMRQIILSQSKRANVGHVGSCLCVVEILCALYGRIIRASGPNDPDRDRFILSKGHAGLALYAALALKGWICEHELDTFCADNSIFGVHPECAATGIDFSTGSLGHGLSFAAGAALAARLQRSSRRIYCLISDAECNEGSVWEAVTFAAHHKLTNLTAIIDMNGQQAFGLTRDVLEMSNMTQRWQAFGWRTEEVDGHSLEELVDALTFSAHNESPTVILANTIFGKGISFMEQGVSVTRPTLAKHSINWHYLPMSDEEYRLAILDLEQS